MPDARNIPCTHCERSHRDQEKVDACGVRKEKRLAREAARQKDVERRLANQKKLPVDKFVRQEVAKGSIDKKYKPAGPKWDTIVAALNKNYPVREEGKYTLYDVVEIDSRYLNWPTDLETTTLLRLERVMTGDFMTKHPLALPVDGSYSLQGVA
jgi:hypothetical protein